MDKIEHLPYTYADKLMEIESEFTYSVIMGAIKKYVPPGASILDIGSGRGELMEKLADAGYEVCGCDIDDECVRLSERYGKTWKIGVHDISPEKVGSKFDCVLLSHVLEHLNNPMESLLRLASVSNGIMVISVPNPHDSLSIMRSMARREIKYTNTGHLMTWDWAHIKTFIEIGCEMKILEYFYDSVAIPLPNGMRRYFGNKGLLFPLESRYLRAAFPRLCRSITVVISTKG